MRLFDPLFFPDPEPLGDLYDFITCTETIEHFHRPAEEFARLDRMLRPGGVMQGGIAALKAACIQLEQPNHMGEGDRMIGAIAGDIIGSVYEVHPIKTKAFPLFHPRCRFTDDSVLTIAVAQAILTDRDYRRWVWEIGRRHPHAGFGGTFIGWLRAKEPTPYNSWGNGSAMRVSPVGWAFDSADRVLREAARSAEISHNHPEGIKGAQAAALAVFLARKTRDKALIKRELATRFGYDLDRTVDGIRPSYGFDVSCQGTVPEAVIAFLEADAYEDAVRNAISLGGDSDTLACITGAIAEAYYGPVAQPIREKVKACLTADLWSITEQFCREYGPDDDGE